jgi:hypothetical protein
VAVNFDAETRLFVIQHYVHDSERLCGRSRSLSSVDEVICQQDLHDQVALDFSAPKVRYCGTRGLGSLYWRHEHHSKRAAGADASGVSICTFVLVKQVNLY